LAQTLTANEIKICELIKENRDITVLEIIERLGLSESTVNRVLKSLTDKGIITRIGSKKSGSWKFVMP